jgi:hypothetical protein
MSAYIVDAQAARAEASAILGAGAGRSVWDAKGLESYYRGPAAYRKPKRVPCRCGTMIPPEIKLCSVCRWARMKKIERS